MTTGDVHPNGFQQAEADHRIANHLSMLASYVRLTGGELARRDPGPDVKDLSRLLEAIVAQITVISQLHRLLSSEGMQSSVDLGHHLGLVCSALGSGLAGEIVIVRRLAEDCRLAPHRLLPTAQIVAEIITNAIKFSGRPSQSCRIEVSCSRDAGGTVRVEINDNGPGLPTATSGKATSGTGSRVVRGLVDQIGGTIDYRSTNQGLSVGLSIPPQGTGACHF
ncbi:sensor histidine kinase [Parvularcula sp. LCG005]|uniref:sensor histidine kinase n=1 Tax=Parvularcula sp. LCG005 TaxID=3078805 RepID=UPI002943D267|nr:sensor histidine kinase [Parvularcula sp. LCG005]WOI52196.1 sensor histidine kinase [Parvularcula sp. LCG005]